MQLFKKSAGLFGGLAILLTPYTASADPFAKKDLPFDQTSWITTHNAYEKINQNLKEIPQQLTDGVRGFMLDLYFKPQYTGAEAIRVCHGNLACYGPVTSQLRNEFVPFLKNNPTEVVTLFLETYINKEQLQSVFSAVPQLADYSFNPAHFSPERWPTLNEMANINNRLILLTDRSEIAGDYPVNGKAVTVLYDRDWLVQNKWETLGPVASNLFSAHDFSCPTRWDELPLSTSRVEETTGKHWNRLFLMNQFHYATSTAPDSAAYDNNLTYLLRRADNCGRQPNFVGVNNYKNGDLSSYTTAKAVGGIYLWEGNNADKKQDAVCVIPRGQRTLSLPSAGCENDEARSLSLTGIDKGTRISLFDSASANREDDHVIIDIKRNIGMHERVVISTFEKTENNSTYQMVFARNNGLDGKVSRIQVEKTPTDFSDAAIALYEGNNASQNLDCVVPFDRAHNVKMKSNGFGCSNDEIRSAKILKAKAGTRFIMVGHPNGEYKEGFTTVTVLKNITTPLVVPSFNHSYEDQNVRVINERKPIDGKISFGEFDGAR
jgi:hypothetical protein